MVALFRIVEPSSGSIEIDGVNLLDLGLSRARQATTIIPQDPVLFRGTVAHNLDPFSSASSERHKEVITRARLPSSLLDVQVDKGGTNLSAGERQLLCFARALLHPRRVLVLDEATSNLDRASDDAIQALLRSEFATTTLLTIAHRLGTVVDYHTILVMGGGRLLEHGAPSKLLETPGGTLATLAGALGATELAALKQRAHESAQAREGGYVAPSLTTMEVLAAEEGGGAPTGPPKADFWL